MQDELLLRYWSANHDRFSADFHNALGLLGARVSRTLHGIRRAYGPALRGGLAGAITLVLWASFMALATPAASHAEPLHIELAAVFDGPAEFVA